MFFEFDFLQPHTETTVRWIQQEVFFWRPLIGIEGHQHDNIPRKIRGHMAPRIEQFSLQSFITINIHTGHLTQLEGAGNHQPGDKAPFLGCIRTMYSHPRISACAECARMRWKLSGLRMVVLNDACSSSRSWLSCKRKHHKKSLKWPYVVALVVGLAL